MESSNPEQFLWCEKWRPKVIDDCILPESIKETLKNIVKQGRCPNLIFTGTAGVGKTTAARCIANELNADFMVINASMENSVDTVRTKIQQFASTVSFTDAKKVTLLDEADGLSPASQQALRGFIEEFSGNHTLIFTCNFKNKIIDPIHSRCQVIDFKIPSSEKAKLASQFFKRIIHILDVEKIEYDKKVVAELVNQFFPDFRRCLNELQRYASGGKIDSGILAIFSTESFDELISFLKERKFNSVRKWVAQNSDLDSTALFRTLYDSANEKLESKSIPALIMLISDYQFKESFVADKEINRVAFLTELMLSSDMVWK